MLERGSLQWKIRKQLGSNSNEKFGRPSFRIARWPWNLLASVLFRPLHAAAPLEIVHAVSLRDRRNSFVDADHAGFFSRVFDLHRADTLKAISSVTNRGSV